MNIEICAKEYERFLKWDDAMLYCQLLTIDNKNDWRLPTKAELDYIYNSENNLIGDSYWSSTENNANVAFLQAMSSGYQYTYYKTNSNYVRAVRSKNI